jgi:hypothetical protein
VITTKPKIVLLLTGFDDRCWYRGSISLLKHFFNFAFLSAHAIDSNPKICFKEADIATDNVYERTLCYVKLDMSPFNAERYCAKNGMSLYNANRSPAAKNELVERVKLWFGWPKASFTIKGRVGQRCSIINGVGKISTTPCNFANHFFCEYEGSELF